LNSLTSPAALIYCFIPAGFAQTQGPIHYIWRNEAGELVYFSAGSGHVYRTGEGLVWGVIIPG
jgi:hypothetical protein